MMEPYYEEPCIADPDWTPDGWTGPTRLTGKCAECGTTTTCDHPEGLGGEGLEWACPVCGNPTHMSDADPDEGERA